LLKKERSYAEGDFNMGYAYLVGEGCEEAMVLSVSSSADESLTESLLNLHAEDNAATKTPSARRSSGSQDHHKKGHDRIASPTAGRAA
jgi:hypothetical protein